MGRPSKLAPSQWAEIERRLTEGESPAALAREFGISKTAVSARFSGVSERVQKVAHKVAEAQDALATLPPAQQYNAISLAEKLRNISASLASAAEHGAATAHRLNALANSEVSKVDDAAPMESLDNLRNVGVLTKLANDSASIALNLLAANKDTMQKLNNQEPPEQAEPLRPQITRAEWLRLHGQSA